MSLFRGMGSLSVGVFGATVSVIPHGGVARNIRATFREQPEAIVLPDGLETITVMPTLSGVASDVRDLIPDGVVDPGNGKTYRCIAPMTSGSPAADALIKIQLERI
ncbi:head-tail joining protein [Yoonia sp. 208BN28-4]|uniref:head-tail joining protein n=1 Tax=Yoonia sp. 208BN28-4 TaxID=3126505 RepID=UPI0030987A18